MHFLNLFRNKSGQNLEELCLQGSHLGCSPARGGKYFNECNWHGDGGHRHPGSDFAPKLFLAMSWVAFDKYDMYLYIF